MRQAIGPADQAPFADPVLLARVFRWFTILPKAMQRGDGRRAHT
jgi:hypothetical protein